MENSKESKTTILLIATLDTKGEEASFLKKVIESKGCKVILMDTGILSTPKIKADIPREEVAKYGGIPIDELLKLNDKGKCILNMIKGAKQGALKLYQEGIIDGVIGIGGAQGTDIGSSAMRALPIGFPKLMVSTVASGLTTFGPYVGTKDLTIMHSVADMQGLNFLTTQILGNAAAAICGMVKNIKERKSVAPKGIPVAMSMLGTTTPGALRAKKILEDAGFEVVAFHQNGTGGIAMEDLIMEGAFKGVLDINLHELADYVVGGLHGAIKDYRLESAGKVGIPQVIAPGSINYTVQGPLDRLNKELKKRKYIVHNPNLTLVRLSFDELEKVGKLVAEKLNKAKGPTYIYIPLKGFSYPDREGLPHWEPEGNLRFINTLKKNIDPSIPLYEIDAHINDPEFISIVVEKFISLMKN